jgi:hypothetical protein
MSPTIQLMHDAMRVLAAGGWRANEIVIGDMDYFLEKLQFGRIEPKTNALFSLYGLRVRESKIIPRDRATLIDETGKVIRVFEI